MKKVTIPDAVLVLVVIIWSLAVIVSMIDHSYEIPGTVQLSMAAVVAFLWGNKILKREAKKEEVQGEDYYTRDTKP